MNGERADLVERAQTGDSEAFGELVRRYKASVHGYLVGRVRDFACAEDLAQETFVAAFVGLGKLRDRKKFGAWLFGIADTMCALWLRRTRRFERLVERAAAESADHAREVDTMPEPDDAVLCALSRLSPKNAAAIALYYGNRLTQRECAEFLGISHKAFESRLFRAQQQLKKEFVTMTEETLRRRAPGERFDDAVAGEIRRLVEVIGGPYKKEPVEAAEERLRVLFARNEERLSDLIRDASDERARRAAARMVFALGEQGIKRALSLALSEDERVRKNALLAVPLEGEGAYTYLVLEAICEAAFSDEQKADLLIALIRRPTLLADFLPRYELKRYAADSPIYGEMLMRYGGMAISRLGGRIRSDAEAGKPLDLWLANALAMFGTKGIEEIVPFFEAENEQVALAALETARVFGEASSALVRILTQNTWAWIADRDIPLLLRERGEPVVQPSRIDPEAMRRIGERIARALRHPSHAVRLAAVRALTYYGDEAALDPLVEAMNGPDVEIASAAARSLAWVYSARRVEPLVRALETGPNPVKAEAHNALLFLLAGCRSLPVLRGRDPERLLPSLRGLPDQLEALLCAISERRERVIAMLKRLKEERSLTPGERRALAGRGFWDNFLRWLTTMDEESRERKDKAWREERLRRSKEHRRKYPDAVPSWDERREMLSTRESALAFSARAKEFHKEHPEVSAMYRVPTPLLNVNLAAIVRELPEDREYHEKELTAAILRVNGDHALARRRLIEDWWMTRDGTHYRFTDRGRRAWRMEHLLTGDG